MIFTASLDKTAKWVTAGTAVLFVLICILSPALQQGPYFVSVGIALILVSIYLGSYLFRVTAYEVTPDRLIIHRPLKDKVLEKKDIIRVELLIAGALKRSLRLFGNGGLFGYYGKFSNSRFGYMTWYATNRTNPVLLHMTGGKKVIITPNEGEAFVAACSNPGVVSEPLALQHA